MVTGRYLLQKPQRDSMDNLLINPKTKTLIEAYAKDPIHALILTGQKGVGLRSLAKALAKKIADQNVVVIEPKLHKTQKTANINTEDIRGLAQFTQTRRKEPLVIMIDDADKMTFDAPVAFLKALEEPVAQVYYILTSHNTNRLPSTILSRSQIIEVLPSDTGYIISDIKPQLKQRQVEFIANGLPAEIQRLSEDDVYFRAKSRLYEQAKAYLSGGIYEKLITIPKLKTREEAIDFLLVVSRLAQMKSQNAKSLETLSTAIDNLSQNGNIKAQLTYLATNW